MTYLEDLLSQCCAACGLPAEEHELVLTSRCHPGKGTNCVFIAKTGSVRVVCRMCGQSVTDIKIATKGSRLNQP